MEIFTANLVSTSNEPTGVSKGFLGVFVADFWNVLKVDMRGREDLKSLFRTGKNEVALAGPLFYNR